MGWIELWTRYLPNGTSVLIGLWITVDVEPGARIVDRAVVILAEFGESQRLKLDVTAARGGADEPWRIDELRSPALGEPLAVPGGTPLTAPPCPWQPRNLPAVEGFDPTVERAWCDGLGRQVPRRHLSFSGEGPRHCEWQSSALLHLGPQPGWEIDAYVLHNYARDPDGIFRPVWLAEYEILSELPADAIDTGLTNGNVRLFYLPETYEREIYAVMGETVERWPRLREPAGCL